MNIYTKKIISLSRHELDEAIKQYINNKYRIDDKGVIYFKVELNNQKVLGAELYLYDYSS